MSVCFFPSETLLVVLFVLCVVGALAVLVFLAAVVTIPVIQSVNLLGAIRYLWVLLWITPFEVSTCICLS